MKNILLFILVLALCHSAGATTYYVDNTGGSDANDGLSVGNAWENTQMACSTLVAGDTVLIRSGTYDEASPESTFFDRNYGFWFENNGTAGNYIVAKGYPGDALPLILGDTAEERYATMITNKAYIIYDSLEFRHGWNGITVYDGTADNIIIRNCVVDSCGFGIDNNNVGGFHTRFTDYGDVTNILVENNIFFDNQDLGGDAGVNVGGIFIYSCDTCRFTGNLIYNTNDSTATSRKGIYIKGKVGGGFNFTEQMEIDSNIIVNTHTGIEVVGQGEVNDIDVHHNLIYNIRGMAMKTLSNPGATLKRVNIYNNTVDGGGRAAGIINRYATNNEDLAIFNNVIIYRPAGSIGDYGQANISSNNVDENGTFVDYYSDYNHIYDTLGSDLYWWTGASPNPLTLAEWITLWADSTPVNGVNTTTGDPLFTDRDNRDYTLQEGSPAATGGRGGEWPTYKGAFAPAPSGKKVAVLR